MELRKQIRRSMTWAAYGDAIGYISELADRSILRRRIGTDVVTGLVPWTRRLGGRFGTDVKLPSGCYSDDTQLRLATSRAIRGDGVFDVEAFAKVELPVWRGYALGAGKGTKAAATSLSRHGVHWCSNFFDSNHQKYLNGGGNGAAMRIQPHVWACKKGASESSLLLEVIRNSITTHGHPVGILGAAFHALCLRQTLLSGRLPSGPDLDAILGSLKDSPKLIQNDPELGVMWLPSWEAKAGEKIEVAFEKTLFEFGQDLKLVHKIVPSIPDREQAYEKIATELGAFEAMTVGSATKTSLLAVLLARLFAEDAVSGLLLSANMLGSDTDSIATMAGALLGIVVDAEPPQDVSDRQYLEREAERLFCVATGCIAESFSYPDLLHWVPPRLETAIVGRRNDGWVVSGLGHAVIDGAPQNGKGFDWQWLRLDFGQHILVKLRDEVSEMDDKLLPFLQVENLNPSVQAWRAPEVATNGTGVKDASAVELSLDEATDAAINSKFAFDLVGRLLMQIASGENGVDRATAFAAIVAKAKQARLKRGLRT